VRRPSIRLHPFVAFGALLFAASAVYGFHISGPALNKNATTGALKAATDDPPFQHWDLREFPQCKVPWSPHDGTADIGADNEFLNVRNAFSEWQEVENAIIDFREEGLDAAAKCPLLFDGHNTIGWDGVACGTPNDDVWSAAIPVAQRVCAGTVAPGGVVVGPGPDGWLLTEPNNCWGTGGDDVVVGNNIVDGGDGEVDTLPEDGALPAGVLGITAVFDMAASGKILESDILFNDDDYDWIIVAHDQPMGGDPDVWSVAMHEIGHFLGIHHSAAGNANPPGPIMNTTLDLDGDANHSLADDDTDALNWQYTPDLGDAPDPDAGFNKYQSLVHGKVASRKLNGVQLFEPAKGPYHLFGWPGKAAGNGGFEFEWLGAKMDNSTKECEARVTNDDDFDDGVAIPSPLIPGVANRITIVVSTSGAAGRYDATDAEEMLYVNGYMDFNNDRVFTVAGDWVLYWEGTPEPEGGDAAKCTTVGSSGNFVPPAVRAGDTCTLNFDVDVPVDAPEETFWCRFRLDYGEDEGLVKNVSGDLGAAIGAAQFGEVEDYPCYIPFLPHAFAPEYDTTLATAPVSTVALSEHAWAGARLTDPKFTHTPFSGTAASMVLEGNLGTGTVGPLHGLGPLSSNTLPVQGTLRLCFLLPGCGASIDVPLTLNGTRGVGIGGVVSVWSNGLGISIEGAPWTIGTTTVPNIISSSSSYWSPYGYGYGWGQFLHGPGSSTFSTPTMGTIQLVSPIRVVTSAPGVVVGGFAKLTINFVPEPGTWLSMIAGVVCLVALGRRRMKP
jgi:hypothetical protein